MRKLLILLFVSLQATSAILAQNQLTIKVSQLSQWVTDQNLSPYEVKTLAGILAEENVEKITLYKTGGATIYPWSTDLSVEWWGERDTLDDNLISSIFWSLGVKKSLQRDLIGTAAYFARRNMQDFFGVGINSPEEFIGRWINSYQDSIFEIVLVNRMLKDYFFAEMAREQYICGGVDVSDGCFDLNDYKALIMIFYNHFNLPSRSVLYAIVDQHVHRRSEKNIVSYPSYEELDSGNFQEYYNAFLQRVFIKTPCPYNRA